MHKIQENQCVPPDFAQPFPRNEAIERAYLSGHHKTAAIGSYLGAQ